MSAHHNPLLYAPYTIIEGIDPSSPISQQMEQLDQLNVFLLQDIDENFSNLHQIVTTRLIPAVKRFNAASEPTREAAKFWRSFFEAAAAVRVPVASDFPPTSSSSSEQPTTSAVSPSHPLPPDNSNSTLTSESSSAPARPAHSSQSTSSDDASFLAGLEGIGSSTPLPSRTGGPGGYDVTDTPSSDGFIMESPVERFSRLLQADIEKDRSGSTTGGEAREREVDERASTGGGGGSGGKLFQSGSSGRNKRGQSRDDEYDSDADSPDGSFADAYDVGGGGTESDGTPRGAKGPSTDAALHPPTSALSHLTVSSSGLPNFPVSSSSAISAGAASRFASFQNNGGLIPAAQSPARPRAYQPKSKTPLVKSNLKPANAYTAPYPSFPQPPPANSSNTPSHHHHPFNPPVSTTRATPLSVSKSGARSYGWAEPSPSSSTNEDGDSDSDDDDDIGRFLPPGMSPPVTMNFTLPPVKPSGKSAAALAGARVGSGAGEGRFVGTPVKEAARGVVEGLLRDGEEGKKRGLGMGGGGVDSPRRGVPSLNFGRSATSVPAPPTYPPVNNMLPREAVYPADVSHQSSIGVGPASHSISLPHSFYGADPNASSQQQYHHQQQQQQQQPNHSIYSNASVPSAHLSYTSQQSYPSRPSQQQSFASYSQPPPSNSSFNPNISLASSSSSSSGSSSSDGSSRRSLEADLSLSNLQPPPPPPPPQHASQSMQHPSSHASFAPSSSYRNPQHLPQYPLLSEPRRPPGGGGGGGGSDSDDDSDDSQQQHGLGLPEGNYGMPLQPPPSAGGGGAGGGGGGMGQLIDFDQSWMRGGPVGGGADGSEGGYDAADTTASTVFGGGGGGGEATEVFGGRAGGAQAGDGGYGYGGGGGGAAGGGARSGQQFGLLAVDEMLTWNGGRLEDATPVDSPTVAPKRR